MDMIWMLVCALCSLLMFVLAGYGTHVFLEGPKQGKDFEFNVLMVGLTPYFMFIGALILILVILTIC